MFGLIAPCRHQLDDELVVQWRAHLCGLCLTLRDNHGQLARSLTNTDAVMTSVLLQAQQAISPATSSAGPCPLRGMRTATVLAPSAIATRFASTASLTLAAAKAADIAGEQESGLNRKRPVLGAVAGRLSGGLRRRALADITMSTAIDATGMLTALSGQSELERQVLPGDSLLQVTRPSAEAAATIFEATARLAGAEANASGLHRMGLAYGRLAHLMDAAEDLADDTRRKSFNPLTATGRSVAEARTLCFQLSRQIRSELDRLAVGDGRLLRVLLVDSVHAALHRVFDPLVGTGPADSGHGTAHAPTAGSPGRGAPYPPPTPPPPGGGNGPRSFWRNVVPWVGVYCTGYALCASHDNPCTGNRHTAGCGKCGCARECRDCLECFTCCDCR